jgi:hypothetical protein
MTKVCMKGAKSMAGQWRVSGMAHPADGQGRLDFGGGWRLWWCKKEAVLLMGAF